MGVMPFRPTLPEGLGYPPRDRKWEDRKYKRDEQMELFLDTKPFPWRRVYLVPVGSKFNEWHESTITMRYVEVRDEQVR